MRVLFLRPNSVIIATPVPLGLGYVADTLQKKRSDEIEILDVRNSRWKIGRVKKRIREYKPDVVGISAINFEMHEAHELAAAARSEAPKALVVIGGPYASANQKSILDDKNVDVVVVGEGEVTFTELLDAYESGSDLSHVSGIIYRSDGETVSTGPRNLIQDLDTVEVAWELLNPKSYFKRSGRNSENIVKYDHRTLAVFTSRGCPYNCIFCHNVFGKTFRPRSAESVVNEVAMLAENYGIRELEIVDDCFNQSTQRAKAICEGLVEKDLNLHISVPNGLRGDRIDPELLDVLKSAGFYRIAFAVESASPRVQKIIKKNIDLDKVKWSIEETARRGMIATGYFIQGFPTETYDEMIMTGDWAADSELHVASFFYLSPFPGTEVTNIVKKDFTDQAFDDYTTMSVNVSAATDQQLHAANKYAYRRFYLSPRRVAKIIKVAPKNLRTVMNAWYVFRLLFQDSVNN